MESGTLIADRYRLDEFIARGGMGDVWRGFDTRLDRDVVVKILRQGLEGAQNLQERFEQEAKTLASLQGPGFVEIYDYGAFDDGGQSVLFIVMELVEGVSLAELLHRQERLPADQAMAIVAGAAEALDVAHRRGVVHRDVKPANILVDEDGRARVIDFGISQLSGGPRLTSEDSLLGTAPYVAPERLRHGEVTGAADQYALGAVAYECLTGAPPFDSLDPAAITHDHLHTPPPPLPEEVPAEAAAAVLRALEKAPGDRWESTGAMARACRGAMRAEPEPVPIPEPTSAPTEAPTVKERRAGLWPWRFGFVTAVVVALLLLTGLFAWSPWSDSDGSQAEGTTTAATETSSAGDTGAAEDAGSVSPSTSPGDPTSGEATEETTDGTGGQESASPDEGGEETQDQQDPGGDDEDSDPPASGSGEVPDVTGLTTFEARDELREAGFENVTAEVGYYWYTPEPDHCTVMQQTPHGGSTADKSDQVTLSYHERQSEGTSCEW